MGFTVWFTGLSGSGKTTLAVILERKLAARGLRVQRLDGDVVRQDLTADLGFSREDRDKNIARVAFVASLLTRNGVACLASFISPYREARQKAREKIGAFIEIFLDCPLQVCVDRDVKGLYRKALAGEVAHFTGVSDPYEPPEAAEMVIRTDLETPEESADRIIGYLEDHGYVSPAGLVGPHGGRLVNRVLPAAQRQAWAERCRRMIPITYQTAKELENLATGVYSPLEGFLGRKDHESVIEQGRLGDGTPWTVPLNLHLPEDRAKGLSAGEAVGLVYEERLVGVMEVEDVFPIDRNRYARAVFGTEDPAHPGVARLYGESENAAAGPIWLVEPLPSPFPNHHRTPAETRRIFGERGWKTVVAFQTRNAPHLGHEYLQKTALTLTDGLFINPVIGAKKTGDFEDDVIIGSYEAYMTHYLPPDSAVLGILEYEMKYAGPREAVHHAIMRKNFGCSHLIVGRDHAGVGSYYGPYDAQLIFDRYPDLDIQPVKFRSFYYCRRCQGVTSERVCSHQPSEHIQFSGTALRAQLAAATEAAAAADGTASVGAPAAAGDGTASVGAPAAAPGTGVAGAYAPIRPEVLAAIRRFPKIFVG